jgi:hypothetical protein
LVENTPEWVGVFTTGLFAIITSAVVYGQHLVMEAQLRVMVWQGKLSARRERAQNRLIRLHHEQEWVWRNDQERDQLLKLGPKLRVSVGCSLNQSPSSLEPQFWADIQETAYDLDRRLSALDVATFAREHDRWRKVRQPVGCTHLRRVTPRLHKSEIRAKPHVAWRNEPGVDAPAKFDRSSFTVLSMDDLSRLAVDSTGQEG